MKKPQRKLPPKQDTIGYRNELFVANPSKIVEGYSYKDRSTICFMPTLGSIPVRVEQAFDALMKPANQRFGRIFLDGHEVGKAYETMVDHLRNPATGLDKFKYLLTMEHDNVPQPDALMKLYEDMDSGKWDAVGSLYWTKGEVASMPMCYGKVDVFPKDFAPWCPPLETVSECHGLGMGFTLFKTKMFLDPKFERPLFLTEQTWDRQKGITGFTQDLRFFQAASRLGYRFACSTRVLTGHFSVEENRVY